MSPLIRLDAGFMPETIDKAERALLAARLGFYQRGSMVVRSAMVPVAVSGGRQIDAPRLVDVKAHHMARGAASPTPTKPPRGAARSAVRPQRHQRRAGATSDRSGNACEAPSNRCSSACLAATRAPPSRRSSEATGWQLHTVRGALAGGGSINLCAPGYRSMDANEKVARRWGRLISSGSPQRQRSLQRRLELLRQLVHAGLRHVAIRICGTRHGGPTGPHEHSPRL